MMVILVFNLVCFVVGLFVVIGVRLNEDEYIKWFLFLGREGIG